ncbi:MAG: DUF881 domain-containing protein, partial [Actinobacteria bacterium]|nr:DUF881 domain-containing protein [Actinomycetota bacterium]
TQVLLTAIFVLLGFATTAAISGTSANAILSNARQSDLVAVLDDLAGREARLQAEATRLENARQTLLGGNEYQAVTEAKRRANALAQLAGTQKLAGSGIQVTISRNLTATTLLDAIQELRDSGATGIEISDKDLAVRVVANTWFADTETGVSVSGTELHLPIFIRVIGDSSVLAPALRIPGGLVDTVQAGGGKVVITELPDVEINATVPLQMP